MSVEANTFPLALRELNLELRARRTMTKCLELFSLVTRRVLLHDKRLRLLRDQIPLRFDEQHQNGQPANEIVTSLIMMVRWKVLTYEISPKIPKIIRFFEKYSIILALCS